MQVVLLAGGLGTRISEESHLKPKPMIEIGGKPILWHIMKMYSHYGHNDFIICLGYRGYMIKEYFMNYFAHQSDVVIDLKNNKTEFIKTSSEPWKITLVDTGLDSATGHRMNLIKSYLKGTFMMTYGDGVGDINIPQLLEEHKLNKKMVTMTITQPTGRFGTIELDAQGNVASFVEKAHEANTWINSGFFVIDLKALDFISGNTMWELGPLNRLVTDKNLYAHKHTGFWQCMDTLRDKEKLEDHWMSGRAPWKIW